MNNLRQYGKSLIFIMALPLLLAGCRTYYQLFPDESTLYTKKEKIILEKTCKSIDFDYGYDVELKLDYLFPLNKGYGGGKVNEGALSRVLAKFDTNSVIAYYEKMYILKQRTRLRMVEYYEGRKWKNYTFLKKYLLPGLEQYTSILERQVLRRDAAYRQRYDKRKKELDSMLIKDVWREEFEAMWENDYDS